MDCCSLSGNPKGYSFSESDVFASLTCLSLGGPYAYRHCEEAQKCSGLKKWGHYVVAAIEAIPIIGGLFALIELICVSIVNVFSSGPPALTPIKIKGTVNKIEQPPEDFVDSDDSFLDVEPPSIEAVKTTTRSSEPFSIEHYIPRYASMVQTTIEALDGHKYIQALPESKEANKCSRDFSVYADSATEFIPTQLTPLPRPLEFDEGESSIRGPRPYMEDAHFTLYPTDLGIVAGVFDGHGGAETAVFLNNAFPQCMIDTLTEHRGNIHAAMTSLVHQLNYEVLEDEELSVQGSTGVICIIEAKTGHVHTITVGDSEAFLYRKIDGKMRVIPLSPVKNWTIPSEIARVKKIGHAQFLTYAGDKENRYLGINVSRAFGDVKFHAITCHPEIGIAKMEPGDILLMCSDGLTDALSQAKIIDIMRKYGRQSLNKVAEQLTRESVHYFFEENMRRRKLPPGTPLVGDNVTVKLFKAK